MKHPILLTLIMAFAASPAFGAVGEPETDAMETLKAAPAEAAPVDAASPSEAAAHRFSDGMKIPVDGSSLEAFDKSLATIEKQATKAEFTTLNNALDYLLVYDLAAKRDRAKLAAHLDGLTGEEIVDRVQWRKGNKYRGGASDR